MVLALCCSLVSSDHRTSSCWMKCWRYLSFTSFRHAAPGRVRVYDFRIQVANGRQGGLLFGVIFMQGRRCGEILSFLRANTERSFCESSAGEIKTTNSILAPRPRYHGWILFATAGWSCSSPYLCGAFSLLDLPGRRRSIGCLHGKGPTGLSLILQRPST